MNEKQKMKHMVIFSLNHEFNSSEADNFLNEGKTMLKQIPVVKDFEILKEISQNNDYQYGFAMEFDDENAYNSFIEHPFHVQFYEDRWKKEVTKSLEMNFQLFY